MIIPRFAIIEAPSVLGLFPKGVETLPDALLARVLPSAWKLGAVDELSRRYMTIVATRKRCFSTRGALPTIRWHSRTWSAEY